MNLAIVLGTRPEAVKLAPLIQLLREHESISLTVISTGQHKQMLQQIVEWFEITVDIDLELMLTNQSLADLSSRCLTSLNQIFTKRPFDFVFVQGDTTTAFIAALAAFYNKIPVAHVEAGLRTFNKLSPWPEEVNRNLISRIADYHFVPTPSNRTNLLNENIKDSTIFVTGNTVIDALLFSAEKIDKQKLVPDGLHEFYAGNLSTNKVILITGHRRENMGAGFIAICSAIKKLATNHPDVYFVYPVHLNPNVREIVLPLLSGHSNIKLINPLGYPEFVSLMQRSYLILTDSGGVQEEAPSLGKPVLVMRDTTERPEGLMAGTVQLVGTNEESIVQAAEQLLKDSNLYHTMSGISNPYGDGTASERIAEILVKINQK